MTSYAVKQSSLHLTPNHSSLYNNVKFSSYTKFVHNKPETTINVDIFVVYNKYIYNVTMVSNPLKSSLCNNK